ERYMPARRARIYGLKRWPALHIHGSHLAPRELQDARRGRRAMGEALRRWRTRTVRLAERQIRAVLADRSHRVGQDVERQRPKEIETSHARAAPNAQTRHQTLTASVCATIYLMTFSAGIQPCPAKNPERCSATSLAVRLASPWTVWSNSVATPTPPLTAAALAALVAAAPTPTIGPMPGFLELSAFASNSWRSNGAASVPWYT